MRIRLALTLDIDRHHDDPSAERDTQLDALVERADPHPGPDRPIGFTRNPDQEGP